MLDGFKLFINLKGRKEDEIPIHRFDLKMTREQERIEPFLNRVEGEVMAIILDNSIRILEKYYEYQTNKVELYLLVTS